MTDLEQELEAALRKIGMPTDIDDVHLFDISVLAEFICFREAEARIDELEKCMEFFKQDRSDWRESNLVLKAYKKNRLVALRKQEGES